MKKKTLISFHRSLKRQMTSEIAGVVRGGWKCSLNITIEENYAKIASASIKHGEMCATATAGNF